MNTKAIIFDLDGVLIFTDQYHYKAWKRIADAMHIPFDMSVNDRLRGVSRMDSLDIILEGYTGETLSEDEKLNLAAKKNKYYKEYLQEMTPADVQDDVRDVLHKIKERGYKIAIGSSSKNAKYILEKVAMIDIFDAISDGTNIERSKPDPEVFIKAAQYLGIEPSACIVVEDAEAGIIAGKAGGMKMVGIGAASQSHTADYSIHRFTELLTIIE